MVPNEEFLMAIAQIALTLAGFAGLISVFRQGSRKWSANEVFGQNLILESSLFAALFAVAPIALYTTFGGDNLWRFSSAAYIVFVLAWGWSILVRIQNLTTTGFMSSVYWFGLLVSLVAIGIQAGNVAIWGEFAAYMWGLLWMLFAAGGQFLLFVYAYSRSDPPPPGE